MQVSKYQSHQHIHDTVAGHVHMHAQIFLYKMVIT